MKKSSTSFEFYFQVGALVIAVIVIHLVYLAVIRPQAKQVLAAQAELARLNREYEAERSLYILVRDYEQETCFILMIWACAIMAYKSRTTTKAQSLLQEDLMQIDEGVRILPEDTRELSRQLEALEASKRHTLLPRALRAALHRFASTPNVEDVSSAARVVCEAEGERLESELSMIRYIAWAIPSVGFIGTVRGIGDALGKAQRAVEGDISGVTESLGVAFNSTLIALLISIVIMFLLHQLQLRQERFVLDAEAYCEDHLIRHLYTP